MTPETVYAITAAWVTVQVARIIAANAKDKRARAAKEAGQ